MYTQEELRQVQLQLKKKRLAAAIPTLLLLAVAIAVFVAGRMRRSDAAWILSALLTIFGGGYALFQYGLSIRPAKTYRNCVQEMLHGRMRQTEGVLKAFSEDICDRNGLPFHAVLLNVGEKNAPEDDRLFYWDAQKPNPEFSLGMQVRVFSNDNRISRMESL